MSNEVGRHSCNSLLSTSSSEYQRGRSVDISKRHIFEAIYFTLNMRNSHWCYYNPFFCWKVKCRYSARIWAGSPGSWEFRANHPSSVRTHLIQAVANFKDISRLNRWELIHCWPLGVLDRPYEYRSRLLLAFGRIARFQYVGWSSTQLDVMTDHMLFATVPFSLQHKNGWRWSRTWWIWSWTWWTWWSQGTSPWWP